MRRWKPPTPKLGRDAIVLALVTLTAGLSSGLPVTRRDPNVRRRPRRPMPRRP